MQTTKHNRKIEYHFEHDKVDKQTEIMLTSSVTAISHEFSAYTLQYQQIHKPYYVSIEFPLRRFVTDYVVRTIKNFIRELVFFGKQI